MLGQGIVKLTDNNSDDELYAVLIDRKLAQETLADSGEAALVEQDIKPYFRFLTAAEFCREQERVTPTLLLVTVAC